MKNRDRLKEIKARLDEGAGWPGSCPVHSNVGATDCPLCRIYANAAMDIAWLLAEVEELRAVIRKTPAHYRADARAVRDGLRYDRV